MECIVGEDFDMECGICLEGEEYFFQGWILEGTIGDSLRSTYEIVQVRKINNQISVLCWSGKYQVQINVSLQTVQTLIWITG